MSASRQVSLLSPATGMGEGRPSAYLLAYSRATSDVVSRFDRSGRRSVDVAHASLQGGVLLCSSRSYLEPKFLYEMAHEAQ